MRKICAFFCIFLFIQAGIASDDREMFDQLYANLQKIKSDMDKLQQHLTSEQEKQAAVLQQNVEGRIGSVEAQVKQLQENINSVQANLTQLVNDNAVQAQKDLQSAVTKLDNKINKMR